MEATAVLWHICISVAVIFLFGCMGSKPWVWEGNSLFCMRTALGSREKRSRPCSTRCFLQAVRQDWCSSSFSWIAGVGEGKLEAEDPMAPVGTGSRDSSSCAVSCARITQGSSWTWREGWGWLHHFWFLSFFILFDIFKMESQLQTDCLWQHEPGK